MNIYACVVHGECMPDPMSQFNLVRMIYSDTSTIGKLAYKGIFQCFTLERTVRKDQGIMAIPAGTYRITLYDSPHFGRLMPMLIGVPGREAIEIHWGNYPTNSEGCLLVGMEKGADAVFESKIAFEALFPKIEKEILTGPTFITITNGSENSLV